MRSPRSASTTSWSGSRQGRTPPHAPPIEVDQNPANDGSFLALDELRQRQGRHPQCVGGRAGGDARRDGEGEDAGAGSALPPGRNQGAAEAGQLQRLYKSKDDYVARVDRRLKELVGAGWFLEEYVDAVPADARKVVFP